MKHILITYVSHSGSTQEIARFIGDELSALGQEADVRPLSELSDLSAYDCIIAGGLLYRFGWHPEIIRFLEKNLAELQKKKTALFVTGLRLIETPDCSQAAYPVYIDPAIEAVMANPRKPGLLDNFTTMDGYLKQALPVIEKIRPVSLGFFAGKLDMAVLNLPEKLIMLILMLLTGIKAGDRRNWDMIGAWVKSLDSFAQ